MLLPIALNILLCLVVFAVVVGGLAWMILHQATGLIPSGRVRQSPGLCTTRAFRGRGAANWRPAAAHRARSAPD